ncbi:MAG: hypothetical protein LIO79_05855 [Rikenellaceae bacterium]|nr:hypothetical protein [Rikenellaceae bacterium]
MTQAAVIDKAIRICGITMLVLGIVHVLFNLGQMWFAGFGLALALSGAGNLFYYKNSTPAAYRRILGMNIMLCFVGFLNTVDNKWHIPSILLMAVSAFLTVCLLLRKEKY